MITTSLVNPANTVISQQDTTEVRLNLKTNHHSLHSLSVFYPGDIICAFSASEIKTNPSYLTVQVSAEKHIILNPSHLQYTNHSCSPNVFFDTNLMQLVCLKQILHSEELRFFYPSTEWEMAQPFVCNCGSLNCLQLINGAANLSEETLMKYRLTDFIIEQLKNRK